MIRLSRKNINRIRYSYAFIDYLIGELKEFETINKIILYGSVATMDSDKRSDVDIFVDIGDKRTKKKIPIILDKFYSSKSYLKFKALGVDNEINIKIGRLEDWKDLHRSIMSTGIVLYSKYEGRKIGSTKHMILFYWNTIKINRGAFLNIMYGFRHKGKLHPGLLEKYNGIKSGKSAVMFPIQHKDIVIRLIKKYKVDAKIIEVFI